MSKLPEDTFYCILAVILCALIPIAVYHAIIYGQHPKEDPDPTEAVRVDTFFIDRPVLVHDTILRTVKVRVPVEKDAPPLNPILEESKPTENDGFAPDSIDVTLPITQKEYADSTYRVWVSGFRVHLDSIKVFSRTITRTIVKQPRWGVSVGVGASIGTKIEPCIFVGLTYTIKTF